MKKITKESVNNTIEKALKFIEDNSFELGMVASIIGYGAMAYKCGHKKGYKKGVKKGFDHALDRIVEASCGFEAKNIDRDASYIFYASKLNKE